MKLNTPTTGNPKVDAFLKEYDRRLALPETDGQLRENLERMRTPLFTIAVGNTAGFAEKLESVIQRHFPGLEL